MSATPAEIARRAFTDHLAVRPAAELLSRYAANHDPEAFAGLVRQFGPMVLGTCRRVLGPGADADDAFQAVFLALARRADSFRDAGALPAWLHRVALRVARKAQARRAANPTPVEAPEPADPSDPLANVTWRDLRRVLDEELDALPEKLRGPVVLCWLDGLTQDEAADRLGFSLNTLKRRLDDGRALLRARLTRRGLAPVLIAAAALDPTGLRAVVPDALALLAVEVGVAGATIPARVEGLIVLVAATGPTRSFVKIGLALALVAGVATAGVVTANRDRSVAPGAPPEPAPPAVAKVDPEPAPPPRAVPDPPAPPAAIPPELPKPERAVNTDPFAAPAEGAPALTEVRAAEVKPLPPAPVPTVAPARRLGDRQFVGPSVFGPLVISADGKIAAFTAHGISVNTNHGWRGQEVLVWDIANRRAIRSVPLGSQAIRALALSPDGGRLYAGGSQDWYTSRKLFVWDVQTGKLLKERSVSLWALSADGKTLVTVDAIIPKKAFEGNEKGLKLPGPSESTLALWDTADFTLRRSFHYTGAVFDSLAVSADGSKVACGRQGSVTIFDTATGKPVCKKVFDDDKNRPFDIWELVFSPDGKWVAVGDHARYPNPRTVHLLDATTGEAKRLVGRGDLDRSAQPPLLGMGFTPDSKKLAVGFQDAVVVIDVATGKLPEPRPATDLPSWKKGMQHKPEWFDFFRRGIQPDEVEYLYGFTLSADGKSALLGGRFFHDACGLRVVDVATREVKYPPKPLETIKPPHPTVDPFPVPYIAQDSPYPQWTQLADGRWLMWNWPRGLVLEGKDRKPIRSFGRGDEKERGTVLGFILSPDAETLITRGQLPRQMNGNSPDDPQMRFWDVETGKMWGEAVGPEHQQIWYRRAMTVSPDGRTLAALNPDGGIWLWEVATTKPRLRLDRAGSEDIFRFAFSRDGRHLMSHDYHARTGLVWDLFGNVKPAKLTEKDLTGLWDDLRGDDAAKAYQAIGRFTSDPAAAVPFLRDQTSKLPVVTEKDKLAARPFDRGVVVARRAVEALERCGTADAAKALTGLADRLPYAAPAAAAERVLRLEPSR
jgi:RNA polymerase sigma factor (sigma-70 family)